ncbi:DegV family protein [Dysosmobacter sp.]|uniref:DegV family protein n=1 Tax=Dysosmobacter sp. TaxID=2591382 RepID=UPI002A84DA86|nr:DegV family protein [Dysosmobacter sp.]MDY3984644.1 DegV family protein [Dysosmobacter sp.]
MRRKNVIVADSSANLFRSDCGDFMPVPLKILAGEKEYVDDEALDVASMLTDLREYKGRSSTACPSVGDWLQTFGDAEEVYGVSLTSHLSGCYNAACIAAEEYMAEHPNRRVFILDSLSTGPELELLIEKYRELIEAGCTFEEIQERIIEYLKRTHLLFSLESLSNFAKNGRVSPALAAAANLLGIRIVGRASDAGDLEPLHKSRGEKRAIGQLWECMQQSGYAGGKVRIRHSDNRNAAEMLSGEILSSYPDADIRIGVNRGLCSYYAERGGILVGFETQK